MTADDAWVKLERMFAARSGARVVQIRMQLANLKKKDITTTDYFQKMKALADTLSAIGMPLQDDEIISYILVGLGIDYDSFVMSITTRSDLMTLDEVYSHLMIYELCQEHNNVALQFGSSRVS